MQGHDDHKGDTTVTTCNAGTPIRDLFVNIGVTGLRDGWAGEQLAYEFKIDSALIRDFEE